MNLFKVHLAKIYHGDGKMVGCATWLITAGLGTGLQ